MALRFCASYYLFARRVGKRSRPSSYETKKLAMDLGNVYVLDTLNFYPRNRHTFIPHIINVFLLLTSVFFFGGC